MRRKQVWMCAAVLGIALLTGAGKKSLSPEEEIEVLKERIEKSEAQLRTLRPAVQKLKAKAGSVMATQMRPDTGFKSAAAPLSGPVSWTWKSKHAGKVLAGDMTGNGEAPATISGRKTR